MQKITFEDTTVTKKPYVIIDNTEYEVQNGTYSGGTDLNANTFNTLQNNVEDAINTINNVTISDNYGTSTTDGYSQNYVNSLASNEYGTSQIGCYSQDYINNEITTLNNKFPIIDKGISDLIEVAAYSYVDTTIQFNETFTTAPNVQISLYGASTNISSYTTLQYFVKEITTTGFTIRTMLGGTGPIYPQYIWLAIS